MNDLAALLHGSRYLHVGILPEGDHSLLFLEEDAAEMPTQQVAHLA
jgi:hypothetical protein